MQSVNAVAVHQGHRVNTEVFHAILQWPDSSCRFCCISVATHSSMPRDDAALPCLYKAQRSSVAGLRYAQAAQDGRDASICSRNRVERGCQEHNRMPASSNLRFPGPAARAGACRRTHPAPVCTVPRCAQTYGPAHYRRQSPCLVLKMMTLWTSQQWTGCCGARATSQHRKRAALIMNAIVLFLALDCHTTPLSVPSK